MVRQSSIGVLLGELALHDVCLLTATIVVQKTSSRSVRTHMSKRCLFRFAVRHAYQFVANVNQCVTVLRLVRKLTGKTTG